MCLLKAPNTDLKFLLKKIFYRVTKITIVEYQFVFTTVEPLSSTNPEFRNVKEVSWIY